MDTGLTGSFRPAHSVNATVAPKPAEAVTPQARTDLPHGKAIAAPSQTTRVLQDKKRGKDHDSERRHRREPDPTGGPAAEEIDFHTDQAANAYVNAYANGYISNDPAPQGRPGTDIRAYHEKLAGEKKPIRHRVEKLA